MLVKTVTVCMLVIAGPLVPFSAGQDGSWRFDPGPGGAPADNCLDLRRLNEDVAGQHGFVRRSADGAGLLLGDGTPVRFWGTNTNVTKFSDAELDEHAGWLARLGINMVRISGSTIIPKHANSNLTDVDEQSIRNHWRAIDALKKRGIYITIHHYWGKGSGADVTRWGLAGYTGKSELWGLLFFNKDLQRGYRAWLKELYTRPNPSTGIPLAKDQAVGLIILQNEDSLLFWTSQRIAPEQKAILGTLFADWAKARYGSLGAAMQAWGGDTLKSDRLGEGMLGLYDIHQATVPQTGGKANRIADQYRFFVETMRRFNTETARYLREELGCRQLICAENWRTANDAMMLDAERFAYTANDVIAKNHYFSGAHEGPARAYAVRSGDLLADRSVLFAPRMLPLNMKHFAGFPSIVTESTWTNPNLYQTEAAFLAATYGSMTGLNGFYWFATGGAAGYAPLPMIKFPVAQPSIAGMFPAAALVYRKAYVRPAEVVVREQRTFDDLWARKLPLICEDEAFDPLRDPTRGGATESAMTGNPLAFLVGRVEVSIGANPGKSKIVDISSQIDTQRKIVRSITGELEWNFDKGVCTVNAPKAQGACGFLDRLRRIELADVTLESADPYATVLVVPLDDRPIAQSGKVLVQIGTTARPTGWKTEPATFRPKGAKEDVKGEKIVDLGRSPWRFADAHLSVQIKNRGLARAALIDSAGQTVRAVAVERNNDGVAVKAPADTLYLVLSREE